MSFTAPVSSPTVLTKVGCGGGSGGCGGSGGGGGGSGGDGGDGGGDGGDGSNGHVQPVQSQPYVLTNEAHESPEPETSSQVKLPMHVAGQPASDDGGGEGDGGGESEHVQPVQSQPWSLANVAHEMPGT